MDAELIERAEAAGWKDIGQHEGRHYFLTPGNSLEWVDPIAQCTSPGFWFLALRGAP